MQINYLNIDDELIQEAMQLSGLFDKQALFVESLRALIQLKKPEKIKTNDITALFGIVQTPITATLEQIEQGIIEGAIDDSH